MGTSGCNTLPELGVQSINSSADDVARVSHLRGDLRGATHLPGSPIGEVGWRGRRHGVMLDFNAILRVCSSASSHEGDDGPPTGVRFDGEVFASEPKVRIGDEFRCLTLELGLSDVRL